MKNIIRMYKQEPFEANNVEWYLLTQINFRIDGRKLYNKRKKEVVINPYFPHDEILKIKNFNVYYISAFSNVENADIDSDFQLGFNNIDAKYESEMVSSFISDKKNIYLIIRPATYMKDIADLSEIFDKKSGNFIEYKYNVVYKCNKEIPTYIIKLDNVSQLVELDEYIYGYLVDMDELMKISLSEIMPFSDLKVLDSLLNGCEWIILRTPLFANYNLTIYSRGGKFSEIKDKTIECARNVGVEFEEKIEIKRTRE